MAVQLFRFSSNDVDHATDRRSIVLFVGYQAMHTLGRRILEKSDNVKIYGEKVRITAEIRKNIFSDYSDIQNLAELFLLKPLFWIQKKLKR